VYDRVVSGFRTYFVVEVLQYFYIIFYVEDDYPTNNTLPVPSKNQYDTLLPKVPVVGHISKPGK